MELIDSLLQKLMQARIEQAEATRKVEEIEASINYFTTHHFYTTEDGPFWTVKSNVFFLFPPNSGRNIMCVVATKTDSGDYKCVMKISPEATQEVKLPNSKSLELNEMKPILILAKEKLNQGFDFLKRP